MSPTVEAIAQAINRQEQTDPRYNNPGAIMDVTYFQQTGQFRLMTFPTLADGWNALYAQIQTNIDRGLTLQEFFAGKPGVYGGYAPQGHGGNNPQVYAANVSSWTGIPLGVPIRSVSYSGGSQGPALPLPDSPGPELAEDIGSGADGNYGDDSGSQLVQVSVGIGIAAAAAWLLSGLFEG